MATANGVSFSELVNHAAGKAGASREDFESAMAARGYRSSDVRKLGKAFDRVKESGNDYVLHPEKGFNVFDNAGKQKTGSGKVKGNKAGLDIGDLIGLGGDVSLLAGALRKELPGYTQSKQPKTNVEPEPVNNSSTPEKQADSSVGAMVRKPAAKKAAKKSTTEVDVEGMKKAYPNQVPVAKPPGPAGKNGFDILDNPFNNASKNRKASADEAAPDEGIDWQKIALGDIPLLWDAENYKDLGAAFNPAQFWSENARQFGAKRGQARLEKTRKEFERDHPGEDFNKRTVGGMPDTGLFNPIPFIKGMPSPRILGPATVRGFLGPATEETINAAKKPAAAVAVDVEENFLNNLTEDLNHIQHKKGGKIYAKGGLFDGQPAGEEFGDNPAFFDTPYTGDAGYREQKPAGAEYEERNPGKDGSGNGMGFGDILAGAVRYGIPAAYLGAEQNQIQKLRGRIDPTLTAPELMVGSVQDLAKPDFSLPYRPELQGSSLAEAQNTGLARDAYTRDRRADWEMKNSASRMGQRNQILDRINQAAIQRSGIKNQENMIKSSNAFNEFAYLLGDRGVTASSLFQNLDNGIYGAQVAHDSRSLSQAQEIIRNPEKYSPTDYQWAKKTVSGNMRGQKRMGGRIGKFSKA